MEKETHNNQGKNSEPNSASKFTKLRYNHKFRLWIIGILLVIVALVFVFFEKLRVAMVIAFIALLAAFGLEATKNDWDIQKLFETKSLQESQVARDEKGNVMTNDLGQILFDKLGNITTDKAVGKKADEYNCDDFSTQQEAQAFFLKVGGVGNDENRLDGNKDGQACERLPKGKK